MNKQYVQLMVCPYSGIILLFSQKNWAIHTYYNMYESQNNYAERTTENMIAEFYKMQTIEAQSRSVVAWWEGDMKKRLPKGARKLLGWGICSLSWL